MNDNGHRAEDDRSPVRVEGRLRDCRTVRATAGAGDEVEGLTATVAGDVKRYGEAYHVTFPQTRDLDLWVAAVMQAWAEAQQRGAALPDWLRRGATPGELQVIVWGRLRCGQPIPPTGVRPATVLAERAQFPGLDAAVLCRAEELWNRACRARRK